MAYNNFTDNEPTSDQLGTTFITSIRNNLMALRDAVNIGIMPEWNYSIDEGLGSTSQPQYAFYKKGSEWIKITFTWGSVGGAADNVETMLVEYSANNGATYVPIGLQNITYDANGYVLNAAWN